MNRKWNIASSIVVDELKGESFGQKGVIINDTCSLSNAADNCIMFATTAKWQESYIEFFKEVKNAFIIVEPSIKEQFDELLGSNEVFVVDNARLTFAKALKIVLNKVSRNRSYKTLDNGVVVGENVKIGENVLIEPFVLIDHDCVIGDNTIIKTGAKIRQNVIIGDSVVIGENAVIGCQGLGLEIDENGEKIRIPHIGGVIIGSRSEIGAHDSIVSGTMEPTIIEENCFLDDFDHIAHNCHIGKHTTITGCCSIAGSTVIGEYGYVGSNSTLLNGITLGKNCFVGQAASVQRSFGDDVSLVGSPAREFNRKK